MRKALVCSVCYDVYWVDKSVGIPYRAWWTCKTCMGVCNEKENV